MSVSSALSPEFDRARIASLKLIMPRSPWLASAGWTKRAGVPVEASVAAIFRAICPLLPIPVTISRPRTAEQGVQVQNVRGGVTQLLLGQCWCAPIRALLLLRQLDAEQVLTQIAQPVPVGKGTREPRGNLCAVDRPGHYAQIVIQHRQVE